MSKLVTIYGGSGFVGRYITQRMAQLGWRVRVAVRRPNEALFVKPYGVVGQVEPVFCNIRDDDSVRAVMKSADAVVNCVGLLVEEGANRFDAVQAEGAARIARIAAEEGVGQLVQLSAIGADSASTSAYSRSKAAGEGAILEHFPRAVILRPSVIFGPEDQFFNRFAGMTQFSPILPLVGAATKFQPVWVEDVAAAAVKGVLGEAKPGVYELGGPEVKTFRELMEMMLTIIRRRRLTLNLPFPLARLQGSALDLASRLTRGLLPNKLLTRDQVENLAKDNIVSPHVRGFKELGIEPTPMSAVLPDYLWRFRPTGQYSAITDSARDLR